ncbi:O-linked N-acetylglucosamine transferase, SPINDLY family protein [Oscillatoria sp. FACHB-1407]|uniref:O-linked N-acetylglucosamine transferase, SPINDLY family protein n=1 Tax=Oscillatoria sp. FACHB-1407 TaxID=2692847 RepID=UPI001686646E|nr:O-linked N-acetylglucosamine transferase, SPINDLY family protein [Oscillatoria sp. FACHB-1407]MBD2464958.1 O-linked N-acetylglucosamine transferase, SPINDLY family protein [Oscillatoria sp. FACHB-1407]
MNFQASFPPSSAPSSEQLVQQAISHIAANDYASATVLCEQALEISPNFKLAYWYLGLTHLLQEQEAEAQVIWLTTMAEGDADHVEQWTQELLTILKTEAEQRASRQEWQLAWGIRQYCRELDPTDSHNLLHLLQLTLQLEQFTPSVIDDLGLVEHLQAEPVDLDPTFLQSVVEQVLNQALEHPRVFDLVQASVPYMGNRSSWIELLLSKAVILAKLLRQTALACRYGELCLTLDPHHAEVLLRLASFYQDAGRYGEGIELAKRYFAGCQTAIQKVMGNAVVLRGLMTAGAQWQEAEMAQDRGTALLRSFLAEYKIEPDQFLDASIMCTPVFFYPYFGDRPALNRPLQNQLSRLYQDSVTAYVQKHVKDYQPFSATTPRRPAHDKLRIGYLSRCLWRHSVGWLSRWVFQHYDRDRFEVYAYFNHQSRIDDFSRQWFASQATHACCFDGDPLGIAKAIQDDEIDILVDLDSITADYTCGVMALKPAPIQVTWLGLDASGLPAIDYFLADPYVLPDSAQEYYAERIWRLPETYIAVDGFEVGVPSLRRGDLGIPEEAIVYLSAQSAYKRHPATIRLQMQIIKAVPNAYFLVKGSGDQQGLQAFFRQIAAEEGVESDRLKFLPHEAYEENHRANLKIADVVLDTFPYNGATTTLETLWMGIPLVTRVGDQFAARNSYTMLVNAGIEAGIAWTDEEYVDWGIRLGKDAALREQISWQLWRSRQTAPLWNGQKFTCELERAYIQMWDIYQNQT